MPDVAYCEVTPAIEKEAKEWRLSQSPNDEPDKKSFVPSSMRSSDLESFQALKHKPKAVIEKPKFKLDKLLILLALMRFVVDSSYSVMAPFFPQILDDKDIDPEYNGYIFSMFSFALIVSSPLVGYYLARYERMNFLRCGLFCLGCSMLTFGLSTLIPKEKSKLFLTIVFIARFVQGAASSVNDTTILSITGLMYKNHQDIAIAIILMFSGIGYTLAPFFGSILYKLNEMAPYIFFAVIQILFAILLGRLLPQEVNDRLVDSVMSLV